MKAITIFLFAAITTNGLAGGVAVKAQESGQRPAVSVPIKFVGAEPREASTQTLLGLMNDSERVVRDGNVPVVDASFAVDAKALSTLAPSLQPRLFVGNDYYEVYRVEYENWDSVKSQPLDDTKPVGQTHFYHFLIPVERAENVRAELPVFMTTLTLKEMILRSGAELTLNSLKKVDEAMFGNAIQIDRALLIER